MNVYDFDGTIYDGDSTIDFYRFCIARHPCILRALPRQLCSMLAYLSGSISKTEMKQGFYGFLKLLDNVEGEVAEFWKKKGGQKVKGWYREAWREDDVVISASPRFLLAPICRDLRVATLIASEVEPTSGKALSVNCHGEEKVRLFCERYGDVAIGEFYSDSKADSPMARLADRAFLVRGSVVSPWPWP